MKIRNNFHIVMLALAFTVVGCAGGSSITMSSADKANIKAVTLLTQPTLPTEMFYHGQIQNIAWVVGGAVGGILEEALATNEPEQLLEAMRKNKIDLPMVIANEFFRLSTSNGLLTQANSSASAQGDLSLAINVYGFSQRQGFSSLLYPTLNVTATIKKPSGEIAWQQTEFVTPLNANNKYGYEFDQYLKDPELLKKTWTNVAGIVSRMLIKELAMEKGRSE